MSVVRIEKNKNYTTMSNYHLRDKNLSLKAKGLLSVVLSLPDNWDYSIEGLVSILKEERRAVKNTLEELVQNKYLIVLKLKAIKGKRKNIEYIYTFYEKPFNQENLNELLNNIDKEELIKYDYGINLDNVDIHNVYLQEDTQINKEELSKDYKLLNNNIDDDDDKGEPQKENLIDFIENNMHPLTPIELEVVCKWEDNDLTRYAIKQAVLNNARSIKYIDRVLYNYKKLGITTVQQAIEEDEKFQKRKEDYKKIKQDKYENRNLSTEEINKIMDEVLDDVYGKEE